MHMQYFMSGSNLNRTPPLTKCTGNSLSENAIFAGGASNNVHLHRPPAETDDTKDDHLSDTDTDVDLAGIENHLQTERGPKFKDDGFLLSTIQSISRWLKTPNRRIRKRRNYVYYDSGEQSDEEKVTPRAVLVLPIHYAYIQDSKQNEFKAPVSATDSLSDVALFGYHASKKRVISDLDALWLLFYFNNDQSTDRLIISLFCVYHSYVLEICRNAVIDHIDVKTLHAYYHENCDQHPSFIQHLPGPLCRAFSRSYSPPISPPPPPPPAVMISHRGSIFIIGAVLAVHAAELFWFNG